MRKAIWAVLFTVGAAAMMTVAAAPAPQGSGYHLLKKLTLGGDGGWDYLSADPTSHRLFISRGTHIMVVDMDGAVVVIFIVNTEGRVVSQRAESSASAYLWNARPTIPLSSHATAKFDSDWSSYACTPARTSPRNRLAVPRG